MYAQDVAAANHSCIVSQCKNMPQGPCARFQKDHAHSQHQQSFFYSVFLHSFSFVHVRITSRPWMADPFLEDLLEKMVFSNRSLANKIKHSPLLADKLQEHIKLCTEAPISGKRP